MRYRRCRGSKNAVLALVLSSLLSSAALAQQKQAFDIPADGAFVRQGLAADGGDWLTDVRAVSVTSVADGPPIAYLLTADGVLRLVLE